MISLGQSAREARSTHAALGAGPETFILQPLEVCTCCQLLQRRVPLARR